MKETFLIGLSLLIMVNLSMIIYGFYQGYLPSFIDGLIFYFTLPVVLGSCILFLLKKLLSKASSGETLTLVIIIPSLLIWIAMILSTFSGWKLLLNGHQEVIEMNTPWVLLGGDTPLKYTEHSTVETSTDFYETVYHHYWAQEVQLSNDSIVYLCIQNSQLESESISIPTFTFNTNTCGIPVTDYVLKKNFSQAIGETIKSPLLISFINQSKSDFVQSNTLKSVVLLAILNLLLVLLPTRIYYTSIKELNKVPQ